MIKAAAFSAGLTLAATSAHAQLFAPNAISQGWAAGQAFANGYAPSPPAYMPQTPAPDYGPQFHSYSFPDGRTLRCTTIGFGSNAYDSMLLTRPQRLVIGLRRR